MRGAARTDDNQPLVVDILRRCGCRVLSLAPMGKGVPDLLVGTPRGKLILIEVKDGKRKPSERRLNAEQVEWHREWRRYPLFVVENLTEALDAIAHECTTFDVDFLGTRACAECGRSL